MDHFESFLNKSFKFLSYRPRSEKEVRDYLVKKKANDLIIEKVIKRLKEQNFLNDLAFTKWWIEQRTRFRPKAERVIRLELDRKGIARDLIEEALLDEDLESESDFDKAKKLALKKIERLKGEENIKVYEKTVRFLAARGFTWDTIKEVVDQLIPKRYN